MPHLYLATERTQEEKESMQIITLAGVGLPYLLTDTVCNYNRSHTDVRIVMKDYATDEDMYDYTYANGVETLKQELLTGSVPDILCTDNLPFDRLANKGLFADLAPLLEKDERFSETDYYMNFFDSLCYGGKQQRIAFSYTIETNFAKTEFVGEQQGRSPSEFLDMLKNLPDGMTVYSDIKREDITFLMREVQGAFIDTEQRTCSFDSPEFIALLELAGSLQPRDYTSVWDVSEFYAAYVNDKALLYSKYIYRPINFHEVHSGIFRNEPVTLVGYPATDGNGGIFSPTFMLSLNTQSIYETEVMDFFMELLGEDYQRKVCLDNEMHSDSLPVLRSALEEDCTAATKGANRKYYMGSEVNTGNATEEEMAQLLAYIEGITVSRFQDYTIQNVIEEEAEMFYAGDQTAEETARMIQSRVGLYLSE
ncbi:MAG: hypothetical protein K2I93_00870 [Oscillospiraceae bacterium]|nr:hypothetical protein [Oscillospiraceae bacterium]